MKVLIASSVGLNTHSGSWLLNKSGDLILVLIHVPSTTYVNRGLEHLCCTDAEFLWSNGFITEEDAMSIALYCFKEWKHLECDDSDILITDTLNFSNYAELRYAMNVRKLVMKYINPDTDLDALIAEYPDFDKLNQKWYPKVLNDYVKVSKFGNQIEFRISSEDGTDWNSIIIDDVLLNPRYRLNNCRISILRESSKGYKAYFMNATLSDILENDNVVLSAVDVDRRVVNGELRYIRI